MSDLHIDLPDEYKDAVKLYCLKKHITIKKFIKSLINDVVKIENDDYSVVERDDVKTITLTFGLEDYEELIRLSNEAKCASVEGFILTAIIDKQEQM